MKLFELSTASVAIALGLAGAPAHAADNNGTDPTKPTSTATLSFENIALTNGLTSRTLNLNVGTPISRDSLSLQAISWAQCSAATAKCSSSRRQLRVAIGQASGA